MLRAPRVAIGVVAKDDDAMTLLETETFDLILIGREPETLGSDWTID